MLLAIEHFDLLNVTPTKLSFKHEKKVWNHQKEK